MAAVDAHDLGCAGHVAISFASFRWIYSRS
jgi:hypothetical protein